MARKYFSRDELHRLESRFRTQLINSLTGFKSLALIGSVSEAGQSNLAVFSQVIHMGAAPCLIGILSRPNTVPRHTLQNILTNGAFTVNHVRKEFYEKAHAASARWETSEFEAIDLGEEYLDAFPAPFVKQSIIKMGCKLNEVIDVKSNGTHLIVGEISHIYLDDLFVGEDGFVDLEKAGTLTVSGLDSYHETCKIARLPYAKPTKREY